MRLFALCILLMFISTVNATTIVTIGNASFDDANVSPNSFAYTPVSSWAFHGTSGVIDPFSGFQSTEAPDGQQIGFIQNGGDFTQDITFATSGNYKISYQEAGRISTTSTFSGNLGYEILLGNSVIHTDSTTTSPSFSLVEAVFFIAAGTYELKFEGVTFGSDDTGYFDNISIAEVSAVPVPPTLWMFGSGVIGFVGMKRKNQ